MIHVGMDCTPLLPLEDIALLLTFPMFHFNQRPGAPAVDLSPL